MDMRGFRALAILVCLLIICSVFSFYLAGTEAGSIYANDSTASAPPKYELTADQLATKVVNTAVDLIVTVIVGGSILVATERYKKIP